LRIRQVHDAHNPYRGDQAQHITSLFQGFCLAGSIMIRATTRSELLFIGPVCRS
jgi:hypothetical protein